MNDTIFREYDIRGKVGSEFKLDEVYALTGAIVAYMRGKIPAVKTIAVGMDGRIHSPPIKQDMCRALRDCGIDVVFIGVCPSPVLYFALHTMNVDGGLMITASHNPKEYNGIKICLGKEVIWGNELKKIRDLYHTRTKNSATIQGTYTEYPLINDYINYLTDHFKDLRGMSRAVIIDCGNGAAGTVLPELIQRMQWPQVRLLYAEVDGTYPHHEADPVIEKNMDDVKKVLATTDVQIGIGLDGDCDRMAPMTKDGYLVPGDVLLALFAREVLKSHPGAAIVFDIKSSSGLIELLEQWHAKPCMSPSGHAIIKDQMKLHNAALGGELSCHFFFNDRYFGYDDGIYAMLRLFEMLQNSGKDLTELLTLFPRKYSTREFRIPCPEDKKNSIVEHIKRILATRKDVVMITIDGVRATMPYGWGIIRASNTQAVLCVRCEADTPEHLEQIKQDFIAVLMPYFDKTVLMKYFELTPHTA